MIHIHVDDLIITTRSVEIPNHCPECKADLREERAIRMWEYQDQGRYASCAPNDDGSRDNLPNNEADFDWPDSPEGGESFLAQSWQCANCDCVLAEATVKNGNPDES